MTRGRGFISALLVVALLGSLGMQTLVRHQRQQLVPVLRSGSRLGGIDTFALGLILGGLRGPLVMILWSNVESQKVEKNLEDVNTRIELIRRLQPEFDTVHIFQMWNMGYNLSVQMATLPNKYACILEAIDYGRGVDAERPDNINILHGLADLYFNKLGTSQEKRYYMRRIRQETRAESRDPHARQPGRSVRRTRHDVMLDEKGFILPELLVPKATIQSAAGAGRDQYNGAELQYLGRFNDDGGFPYGISTLALGYNYFERSRTLSRATGQKHVQVSENQISSRPGMVLRWWAEEEWERAALATRLAHSKAASENRMELLDADASLPLTTQFADTLENRAGLREALFSYHRASMAAHQAEVELTQHMDAFAGYFNVSVYGEHRDIASAVAILTQAEHDYLACMPSVASLVEPDLKAQQLQQLRQSAVDAYQRGIDRCYYIIFRYEAEDDLVAAVYKALVGLPANQSFSKSLLNKMDPKLFPAMNAAYQEALKTANRVDTRAENAVDFINYIRHAQTRLQALQAK